MDLPFHSLLANACDNDDLEVDDCWATETDSDCVTASSMDGDSDGPETAVKLIATQATQAVGPVAEPVAELIRDLVAELVREPVAEPVAGPLLEQVAELVPKQVATPAAEPVPEPTPKAIPNPIRNRPSQVSLAGVKDLVNTQCSVSLVSLCVSFAFDFEDWLLFAAFHLEKLVRDFISTVFNKIRHASCYISV